MTPGPAAAGRDWSVLSPSEAASVAERDPVVVWPLAATEQHGPHLPLSTDVDIGVGLLTEALRLLDGTAEVTAEVWTLPVSTVGASQEHGRFPGTRSVSTEELIASIVEGGIGLARAGVRRLVLSNSHGGNRAAMEAAALQLRAEHEMLVVKSSWPRFPRPAGVDLPDREWRHGLHGGALETAMMLYLRPELVRLEAVTDFHSLGADLETALRRLGAEGEASFAWLAGDLNPLGVVGDARLATVETGKRLVEHYGRILADVILDAADFPLDRLAPRGHAPAAGPIDEETAWALVRRLVPGSAEADRPVRVHAETNPETWIDVSADGSWQASGAVSPAVRDLFDLYLPVRAPTEIVIGQLGQSLDGRIATESGASHYVTGPRDIERLHRLRALVDAVVVGASTVQLDDPRLTVRLAEGPDPVRVVIDPRGRVDRGRRALAGSEGGALVVVGPDGKATSDADTPFELLDVPWAAPERLDLAALLSALRARGLKRVLVEGGGLTVSAFLDAGLLDRLHLVVAPLVIGSGRPSLTLEPVAGLDSALRPSYRRFTLGEDQLFDLDLRSGPG